MILSYCLSCQSCLPICLFNQQTRSVFSNHCGAIDAWMAWVCLEIYMRDFARLGQVDIVLGPDEQADVHIERKHTHPQYIHLDLSLHFSHKHWETAVCKPKPEAVEQHQRLSELRREEIAAPPRSGGMTSEAWGVRAWRRGVGGRGQDKSRRNRAGQRRLAPIINNPDVMA